VIDADEVLEAVLTVFARLKPYDKTADPCLRGAANDDNARLSAATSIARAAIDVVRQPAPPPDDLDQIDNAERSA
jgi:hypothetical protein